MNKNGIITFRTMIIMLLAGFMISAFSSCMVMLPAQKKRQGEEYRHNTQPNHFSFRSNKNKPPHRVAPNNRGKGRGNSKH